MKQVLASAYAIALCLSVGAIAQPAQDPPAQGALLRVLEGADATLCKASLLSGQRSNYAEVVKAFSPIGVPPKSTFETTGDYRRRLELRATLALRKISGADGRPFLYASLPLIITGDRNTGFYVKYNADTQTARIEIIDSDAFYDRGYVGISQRIDRPATGTMDTFRIDSGVVGESKYSVANAFGAEQDINDQTIVTNHWVVSKGVPRRTKYSVDINLDISASNLQANAPLLRVFILGELVSPYVTKLLLDSRYGSVGRPLSYQEWGVLLHAQPKCAAVYNVRTGLVLKTVAFDYNGALLRR